MRSFDYCVTQNSSIASLRCDHSIIAHSTTQILTTSSSKRHCSPNSHKRGWEPGSIPATFYGQTVLPLPQPAIILIRRGAIVIRTHHINKNLHISVFFTNHILVLVTINIFPRNIARFSPSDMFRPNSATPTLARLSNDTNTTSLDNTVKRLRSSRDRLVARRCSLQSQFRTAVPFWGQLT